MNKYKFEIKPEHLKLLQNMYVGWNDCEYGAPEIDPKRPYGNSEVIQDMIDILGLEEVSDGVFKFTLFNNTWTLKGEDKNNLYLEGADEEKLCRKLEELHKDTETVLQICLSTQTFQTGIYEAEEYSIDWNKVK